MKLVYLADIRFPMERANGIQTVETCHALARRGVDVELVVRRTDDRSDDACLSFFDLPAHDRLHLRRVSVRGRLGFWVRSLGWIRRDADIIYTRDLLLADLVRRVTGTPTVYEAHTVAAVFAEERGALYAREKRPSALKLARLDRRERRVCRNAAGVVAITNGLLLALRERHGELAPSTVVPDGCRVPERMPEPVNGRAVYYVGQLYPWKGVDVAVRAMQHVDDAELVVVGGLPPEPDLDRVQRLAQELSLGHRVRFRGFVPPAELATARLGASIFLIPNLDSTTARLYTSPLKLFEAMASGRPIIASDLPSIREVLSHGENALLVPPADDRALAAAIERLLGDRELSARLTARAFEDVKHYSWDARAEKIHAFVRRLVRS